MLYNMAQEHWYTVQQSSMSLRTDCSGYPGSYGAGTDLAMVLGIKLQAMQCLTLGLSRGMNGITTIPILSRHHIYIVHFIIG